MTLQPGAANILALEKGQNRAEQRGKGGHQRQGIEAVDDVKGEPIIRGEAELER